MESRRRAALRGTPATDAMHNVRRQRVFDLHGTHTTSGMLDLEVRLRLYLYSREVQPMLGSYGNAYQARRDVTFGQLYVPLYTHAKLLQNPPRSTTSSPSPLWSFGD
jgi:hypothetical protein